MAVSKTASYGFESHLRHHFPRKPNKKGTIMRNLIMLAAIAAILTFSACKKAEKVEAPVEEKQETTEQVAEAAATAEATAETAVQTATEAVKAE